MRWIEDVTQALWETQGSPSTVSTLNKKVYGRIEKWLNESIVGDYSYGFLDVIWLKCSCTVSLPTLGVTLNTGGQNWVIGGDHFGVVFSIKEGAREDKESWIVTNVWVCRSNL